MRQNRRAIAALLVVFAVTASLAVFSLTGRSTGAEPQRRNNPHIHAALDALRDARMELKNAPHDYHGKRKAALESVDHAIEHLDEIKDL
jgi:hypothetical protein